MLPPGRSSGPASVLSLAVSDQLVGVVINWSTFGNCTAGLLGLSFNGNDGILC